MQKQEDIHKQINKKDVYTSMDFADFIIGKFPNATEKKYFIQLTLISDYFHFLSIFALQELSRSRGFQFNFIKREVDDELHVLQIYVTKCDAELRMKVLVIQMDRVIKVTFQSWIFSELKFKKTNQFSFDHINYLNKKVSNSYKLRNLRELSSIGKNEDKVMNQSQSQLNYLYLSRGLQSLIVSRKSALQIEMEILTELDFMRFFNTQKNWVVSKLFLQILSNADNLMRISSFLNIKQISKLSRVNRLVRGYFFTPSNLFYKNLYEFSFGRTGFDASQMDWVKSLAKKRLQKAKAKHSKFRQALIFRTH